MRLSDLDEVIERLEEIAVHSSMEERSRLREAAVAKLREWREQAVEGYIDRRDAAAAPKGGTVVFEPRREGFAIVPCLLILSKSTEEQTRRPTPRTGREL